MVAVISSWTSTLQAPSGVFAKHFTYLLTQIANEINSLDLQVTMADGKPQLTYSHGWMRKRMQYTIQRYSHLCACCDILLPKTIIGAAFLCFIQAGCYLFPYLVCLQKLPLAALCSHLMKHLQDACPRRPLAVWQVHHTRHRQWGH